MRSQRGRVLSTDKLLAGPEVRSFPTDTASLMQRADWLQDRGVTAVAMESTGVYWIPLYELPAERGRPGFGGVALAAEELSGGWNQFWFAEPLKVTQGVTYRLQFTCSKPLSKDRR